MTTDTVVDRAALEDVLERVRDDGYATAADELEDGLSALAAPVRGPTGEVIAALGISGPTLRLVPILVREATALEERLGKHRPGERAA